MLATHSNGAGLCNRRAAETPRLDAHHALFVSGLMVVADEVQKTMRQELANFALERATTARRLTARRLDAHDDIAQQFAPRIARIPDGMPAHRLALAHRESKNVRRLVAVSKDSIELVDLFVVGQCHRELRLAQAELSKHSVRPKAHRRFRDVAKRSVTNGDECGHARSHLAHGSSPARVTGESSSHPR